jgi:protein SCO1/2
MRNTRSTMLTLMLCGLLLAALPMVFGAERRPVGVEEHIGEMLPLEQYSFIGENDETVAFADLFDRPVVLTLVYYRCPGICTPLLTELASVVSKTDMAPGDDYRMVTISFDPREGSELARQKQVNMLAQIENHDIAADDWRFLTGDAENIKSITEAVGFHYIPDPNETDFVHAATLIFLGTDGKIIRYLNGTRFNPADLKLAVVDATEGRARSFMQRIQALCYSYDPEGHVYALKINRVILGVTLLFALCFAAFLMSKSLLRKNDDTTSPGGVS